jgi:hypothetical protein
VDNKSDKTNAVTAIDGLLLKEKERGGWRRRRTATKPTLL